MKPREWVKQMRAKHGSEKHWKAALDWIEGSLWIHEQMAKPPRICSCKRQGLCLDCRTVALADGIGE